MSAPQLSTYVNGQAASVTGDQLNTFEQTCDSVSQLRTFIGAAGIQVYLRGFSTPADGGQGEFYWNASGTGPDDFGVTNIVPNGATVGCWTRIPNIYLGESGLGPIVSATTLGTVIGRVQILNSDGTVAGYSPIYNTIT